MRLLSYGVLTCAISQFVLLALYSVLQVLSFAASLLDARLHLVRRYLVRHGGYLLWEGQLVAMDVDTDVTVCC